jgi:hypothetical protein
MKSALKRIAAAASLLVSLAPVSFAQGYLFPARHSDLNEHWWETPGGNGYWIPFTLLDGWRAVGGGDGGNELFLRAEKFQQNGWYAWNQSGSYNNSAHHLTWGKPIYAPADGVIHSCWAGFPDNMVPPVVSSSVVGTPGAGPKTIFSIGNHVNILTPDGKIILLAHLKQDSIPNGLCPNRGASADTTTGGNQSYPAASVIPPAQRPAVQRGQQIGLGGNSGNTTTPRLVMRLASAISDYVQGPAEPIPFQQAWARINLAPSWHGPSTKLANAAITAATGPAMVIASPFLPHKFERIYDSISDITMLTSTRGAGTGIDNLGQLRVYTFNTVSDYINLGTTVTEGQASDPKVVAHDANNLVVAIRDSNSNLKLIVYSVTVSGGLIRRDDIVSDKVTAFDAALTSGIDKKIFVAARRHSDNRLKLYSFDLDFSTGTPRVVLEGTRLETDTVTRIAATGAINYTGAAVVVRTTGGSMKVLPYRVTGGGSILAGITYQTGTVENGLDITAIPSGLVTAVRGDNGNLRVHSLETNANGDISGEKEVEHAGAVSDVRVIRTAGAAGGNVVTAVRDASGQLRLIGWSMASNGDKLRRSGSLANWTGTGLAVATRTETELGTPRPILLVRWDKYFIEFEMNMNP